MRGHVPALPWAWRRFLSFSFSHHYPHPRSHAPSALPDPVTGLGSINYDAFAKIFSISTPYTASNDDEYSRTHASPAGGIISSIQSYLTTPNIALIAVIAAALLCVPLAYCAYRKRAQRQRRQEERDLAAAQEAQLHAVFPDDRHQAAPRVHGVPTVAVATATVAAAAAPATVAYHPQGPYHTTGLDLGSPGGRTVEAQAVPYSYLGSERPAAAAPANPELVVDHTAAARERDLLSLVDMGFPFAAAESALRASSWDRDRAIVLLTDKAVNT